MPGDVALQAEGYAGRNAGKLGVFELQEEVVQDRPTYKKQGEEQFLFYTGGSWMVGDDTSKAKGWWSVTSTARTPGAITEPWKVYDGGDWPEVPAAKIIKATALQRREVEAFGDVALQAEGYAGANAGKLGVFELQEEWH